MGDIKEYRSKWGNAHFLSCTSYLQCDCMKKSNQTREQIQELTPRINQLTTDAARDYSSAVTGKSDFTVVAQPGFINLEIAKFGLDFLSNFDCFHPALPADEVFVNFTYLRLKSRRFRSSCGTTCLPQQERSKPDVLPPYLPCFDWCLIL